MRRISRAILVDAFIFMIAIWGSYAIRLSSLELMTSYKASIWSVALLAGFVKPIVLLVFGLYRIYWKYLGAPEVRRLLVAIVAASAILVLSVIGLQSLGFDLSVPRSVLGLDLLLSIVMIAIVRWIMYRPSFGRAENAAG